MGSNTLQLRTIKTSIRLCCVNYLYFYRKLSCDFFFCVSNTRWTTIVETEVLQKVLALPIVETHLMKASQLARRLECNFQRIWSLIAEIAMRDCFAVSKGALVDIFRKNCCHILLQTIDSLCMLIGCWTVEIKKKLFLFRYLKMGVIINFADPVVILIEVKALWLR